MTSHHARSAVDPALAAHPHPGRPAPDAPVARPRPAAARRGGLGHGLVPAADRRTQRPRGAVPAVPRGGPRAQHQQALQRAAPAPARRRLLHAVPGHRRPGLRRPRDLPDAGDAAAQAGRVADQPAARRPALPGLRRRPHPGPVRRPRLQLGLRRPDRSVRGRPADRPARVQRRRRPLQPQAGAGRRRGRTAGHGRPRHPAGARHQQAARRRPRRRDRLHLPARHQRRCLRRPHRARARPPLDRHHGQRPARRGLLPRPVRLLPLPARQAAAHRRRRGEAARAARQARRPRLPRLLRAAPRQGGRLLPQRQGGDHLPRRRRGLPRLRRPDRRSRGVARRHRRLARRGPPARVDPRGHGRERGGRHRLRPARTRRPRTR
ncbi:hypothetical protein SGPA1_12756 [Streptomyces misionensis JCM 4497]